MRLRELELVSLKLLKLKTYSRKAQAMTDYLIEDFTDNHQSRLITYKFDKSINKLVKVSEPYIEPENIKLSEIYFDYENKKLKQI